MREGSVLGFPLFHRENSSAEVSELAEFLLDGLEPFMPLAVSDLSLRFMVGLTAIVVIQFLKVCDLGAETPNLFTKDC
jgi:hypothetical protein